MTPPRDVQDYEAQARQVTSACRHVATAEVCQRCIAAALRAEGRAALLAAANRFDRLADTQRPVSIMGIYEAVNLLRDYANELIAPAPESPPAKVNACQVDLRTDKDRECFEDVVQAATRILRAEPPAPSTSQAAPTEPQPDPPRWRIGRHYGIHVYCGDTPIATFHTVGDAQAAVRAYNASLDRSAPAPDLAAQLDELSNALAPYADAETGAKWDRLRAAVGARDQRIAELEAAILWALGEEGDFPTREPGEGAYWWRTELRRKAALVSRPGAATGEEG